MRDGIVIVDADGHVMDRPHRCYQKYLDGDFDVKTQINQSFQRQAHELAAR